MSFPGIASGIDYNSIIQKYTDLTLQQETPLQTKVTTLNNQQTELLKIQDLVAKFQDTFQAISDPANFSATTPTSSNSARDHARRPFRARVATPGIVRDHERDAGDRDADLERSRRQRRVQRTPRTLSNAGASITPSNGPPGSTTQAQITIDGVAAERTTSTRRR